MEPSRQAASAAPGYKRHRPEATFLYQLVEEHYPTFLAALAARGRTLKTPYRDGTTHVIFEPLDFMARLAALVPHAE